MNNCYRILKRYVLELSFLYNFYKQNLKLLFAFCLVSFFITDTQAQNYKKFEWDILRLGYVIPGGDGVSGGLSLGTEPRYNINDNNSAGIRWELALFGSDLME